MAALDPEDVDIGLTFFLHNALGVADVQAAARCPFREVEFRGHTDGVGGLAGRDCGVGVASDVCCIWESLHQPWMALLLKLLRLFKPCSACAVSPLLQLASGAAGLVLARRRCAGSWRFCCLSNGGLPRGKLSQSYLVADAASIFQGSDKPQLHHFNASHGHSSDTSLLTPSAITSPCPEVQLPCCDCSKD
jgi:hypothetical protein